MSRPALQTSSPLMRWLARWRVPLGFVAAAVVLWLARPTSTSLVWGGAVAIAGEGIRVWAAGHLEKSREVTTSGPYRWTRHPLYVGSLVIGLGLAIAAWHPAIAVLIAAYLGATITSAVRTEEAYLRERFGDEYATYAAGQTTSAPRCFSAARVLRNREYRAVTGLAAGLLLLGAKTWWR